MELITILNRCHHFRGLVYQHAHFSADEKSIEVAVRPRKGSEAVCSQCDQAAPGYASKIAFVCSDMFWAGKFLDEWCRQVMRSRIEPMKKIARSLRQHRELILNYFRAQKLLSSGVVEGLNNKAKVTMRKSYGMPHLSLPRTCALSLTWQVARAGIDPRILLTNQSSRSPFRPAWRYG